MSTAIAERKLPQAGQTAHRDFQVVRSAIDETARTVELAFSSEEPYDRWWGTEVLDHTKGACDLKRLKAGGPLLCDHDARDQVGVIESVRIDSDRVGRAVVRFGKSERAEEVFRDVVDGIRQNVSVGYSIDDIVLAEKKDDHETYRVTRWTPFEISLVSVPADFTVGVGRHAEANPAPTKSSTKEQTMTAAVIESAAPAAPAVDPAKIQADARTAEASRQREIRAIGEAYKSYGIDKEVAAALDSNVSLDQFRSDILKVLASKPLPSPTAEVGLSKAEAARYSVLRALRALVDRDWTKAGLEREVHNAILKRAGLAEAPNNGFYVPVEVQKRDLTAGTPSAGGYLVATDNLAGSFIDLLRNRAVVAQLGATMLSGLVGNVTIPKQSAAATAYWLANEATQITESQQTLGQLALTPKNVGAYTEVSRQLMMQSSPAADSLVMNDLARVLALAIDSAAISGDGASGKPTGIVNTAGIGSVTGTSFSFAKALEFQTDVATANALVQSCAYLTTPAVAAVVAAIVKFSSTASPIWEGSVLEGQMCGFKAMSSNQMPTGAMIFGDFSQVVIGEWGMLELALNPYANFTAAISGIRAIQTVDVGIRQAGAFSYAGTVSA